MMGAGEQGLGMFYSPCTLHYLITRCNGFFPIDCSGGCWPSQDASCVLPTESLSLAMIHVHRERAQTRQQIGRSPPVAQKEHKHFTSHLDFQQAKGHYFSSLLLGTIILPPHNTITNAGESYKAQTNMNRPPFQKSFMPRCYPHA